MRKAAKCEKLEVVVLYGKSIKELDKRYITIQWVQSPDNPPTFGIKTQSRATSRVAPTNTHTFHPLLGFCAVAHTKLSSDMDMARPHTQSLCKDNYKMVCE